MYSVSRDGGDPSRPRSVAFDRRCDGIHRISLRWRRFRESPMGPLRLLHSFHKQQRLHSAPLLQRSFAMSVFVVPLLLFFAFPLVFSFAILLLRFVVHTSVLHSLFL